jgi:hypothetical protein
MSTLTERITEDQITATATYRDNGAPSYVDDNMRGMDWWNVTLQFEGRQVTIPFGMGSGHHGAEPTAHDVLSAVLSDASSAENNPSFEDWAGEYGYDTDSRSAEGTYRQVMAQTEKLRAFLGGKYDTYLWETDND